MPHTQQAAASGDKAPASPRSTPPKPQRDGMRPKEAAAYIGCSRTTLYRLVINGELHPLKIGRSTVFRLDDLNAMLERAKQPGAVVGRGAPA